MADLKELVAECHKRDIFVMVDVVFNHVGYVPEGKIFKDIVPFNEESHYHESCEITNEDWNTEN